VKLAENRMARKDWQHQPPEGDLLHDGGD
jgi:hypothetical protein